MSTFPPLKRKANSDFRASRKKTKIQTTSLVNSLPWKSVPHLRSVGGLDDDDGILGLEEVDNVQVVYEDTADGRIVKFNVIGEEKEITESDTAEELEEDQRLEESLEEDDVEARKLLRDWNKYDLHPQLLRALHRQNFTTPTPIQSRALLPALNKKDVIGIAETGSGKTLAYGLPILHQLLSRSRSSRSGKKSRRKVQALILAPTRELALQISSHLNDCMNFVNIKMEQTDPVLPTENPTKTHVKRGGIQVKPDATPKASKPPPAVSVAAVVGGLSAQKQRRILLRGVDVLVATPGRLWDILQEDDSLAGDLRELKFLVLDEADRMVEAGHFAELDHILRLTLKEYQDDEESKSDNDDDRKGEGSDGLQTFVFSATLSKDLQRNLKKRSKPKKSRNNVKPASTLDDLLMRLDFRDPEPEIIDLSPEGGVVSSLQESQVNCLSADKDTYLYYFLLRYPGRSLVFLSAIDGIRRLAPLLELLNIKAFSIHSQLEQKQRLKSLDRFKSTTNSVLLATDIAARGLDIPSVDHVIHYQIPRSADTYVHRNGRTARAMRNGFSLIMCAPDERKVVRALLHSLGRKESEIPDITIDLYMLDKLKARIYLAKQIDSAQHRIRKEKHEKNWLKEAAEAMDIELDSDLASETEDNNRSGPTKSERKKASAKTAALKLELRQLLAQPLISQGISTRYITSGSQPIADELLAGKSHETMVGMKRTGAGTDLAPSKKRRGRKQQSEESDDEWTGFKIEE